MLMIVANHYAGHGVMYKWDPTRSYQLWGTGSLLNRLFSSLLSLGGEIGVGIFFIITGYFLSERDDFKFPLKLVLETSFYGVSSAIIGLAIYLLHTPLREMSLSLTNIIRSALIPVTGGTWWFVTAYFFLVLLAPVLNKMLSKLAPGGGQQKRYYLCSLFLDFCLCIRSICFVFAIGEGNFFLFSRIFLPAQGE